MGSVDLGKAAALAVVTVLAGCDGGPTGPAAPDADASLVMAVAGMTRAMAPATVEPGEPYVQACPGGGRLVVEGEATYDFSGEGTVHRWDQTMRHEACVLDVQDTPVTADGAMRIAGEARFAPPVDGVAHVVFQESTQTGEMTVTRGGGAFTCSYDLRHRYDADAGDYHVTGTACGRTVDTRLSAP